MNSNQIDLITIVTKIRMSVSGFNDMFMKCLKISKLYPPVKNEYKCL